MKQFSLAALALAILCITFVSASSTNNDSLNLKPKRLRNQSKLVQKNSSVLQVFDPYIGLVEDLDKSNRKQVVLHTQMSMVIVEHIPSSQPTSLAPTLPPSPKPTQTQSPTIDDPNFGKVEGKMRNSAVGAHAQLSVSAFALLLTSGFLC